MLKIPFCIPLEFFTREDEFTAFWLQCNPPPSWAYSNKKTAQISIVCAVLIDQIKPGKKSVVNYMQVYPPSTGRLTPVTYVVAGDERKQIAVSSSPSLPYLSRGIIVLALAWKNSESKVSFVRGL